MKKLGLVILSVILLFYITPVIYGKTKTINQPDLESFYMQNPWGLLVYYGRMTEKSLIHTLKFDIHIEKEELYSVEVDYQLNKKNFLNSIFNHIGAHVGVAVNGAYQDDSKGDIYEFNPHLRFTWIKFPWNKYIVTTATIGEGVSYATKVPDKEINTAKHFKNAKRFLNYLVFELTFAMPSHPNIQFACRIHHRSGIFGLYRSSNSGSTAIGIGLRYLF